MWIKKVLLFVGVALAALGAQAQTKAPAAGAAAAAVITVQVYSFRTTIAKGLIAAHRPSGASGG